MYHLLSIRLVPLYVALFVAIIIASLLGAVALQPVDLLLPFTPIDPAIQNAGNTGEMQFRKSVLLELRLPRILLGLTVGSALAMSGACFQAIFKNPLADPGIVGVSAGAASGAIAYIVVFSGKSGEQWNIISHLSIPVCAMIGAIVATLLLFILSQGKLKFWKASLSSNNGAMGTATLLLAGIAINALFTSINGALIFFSDEQQLRELTFWSLGSLARANNQLTLPVFVFVIFVVTLNLLHAKALNALSLGDNQAYFMGYNVFRIKSGLLALNTCAVGAVVALSGIIGFVGLVIPHIARMIFGANNQWVLPASALLGAMTLLLSDVVARTIVLPAEMPIGVITGLMGSPFFIWLLVNANFRGQL